MNHLACRTLTFLITLAALLAAPAIASAATDRWVDAETGSNAGGNNCKTQATPCATIMQASNSSQSEGNFGTIHVDQGIYDEAVSIGQGNVLRPDDFVPGDSGRTAIEWNGAGVAAFAQANGTIEGFEISGTNSSTVALVSDNATLRDNEIVARANNSTAVDARNGVGASSPLVEGNTILADSGDEATGVVVNATTTNARIIDNHVGRPGEDGFDRGIWVRDNATATVAGNEVLGSDQLTGQNARGILLERTGDVTISRNLVASPVIAPDNESNGIYVNGMVDGAEVSMDHNVVRAMTGIGVVVIDTEGSAVSMDGDLVVANSDRAMYVGAVDDMTITNATIGGNQPVVLNTASVAIDSSILDTPITTDGGGVSCEITFSRGPAITEGGNGCAEFQTTADPRFADPLTFDYHLEQDSPLIDAGNPAAPAPGAVDIDGDARALDGDGECPADRVRDMGIDEVVVAQPDCPVAPPEQPEQPEVRDTAAPDTAIVGASKQRSRKGRFQFTSTEEDSTFECRLDRGRFVPCGSTFRSRKLNYGRHTVFARATDAAGNTDATPAALKFKLKPKKGR